MSFFGLAEPHKVLNGFYCMIYYALFLAFELHTARTNPKPKPDDITCNSPIVMGPLVMAIPLANVLPTKLFIVATPLKRRIIIIIIIIILYIRWLRYYSCPGYSWCNTWIVDRPLPFRGPRIIRKPNLDAASRNRMGRVYPCLDDAYCQLIGTHISGRY